MNLIPARNFRARLLGWLGRARPSPGEALWLHPCRAVHTLGMRFPIDLLFLDARGRVLRVVHRLPPGRIRYHWSARSVVELPPGEAAARLLRPGSQLDLPWPHGSPGARLRSGPAIALLGAALFGQPPAEAAAPIEHESAAEIVFETEWTPDLKRLVEEPLVSVLPAWLSTVASTGIAPAASGRAAITAAAQPTERPLPAERPPSAERVTPTAPELPALALVRPLAPQTLARLLDEAESLYLARQGNRALEAFRQLTELDPSHRGAWLRIGNLHHQRNQLDAAAHAYRRAAAPATDASEPEGGTDAPVRARALANLAAVALEQARDALGELQQVRVPAASATAALRDQLVADLRQVEAAARASGPAAARGVVEVLRGGAGGSGHGR
ncbi:MAG: DUF192 domain-containing protein [Betaproteobacteria bacterium]|nr:DUF192 domain-containing protein [Betaproteobacteria bacterium]